MAEGRYQDITPLDFIHLQRRPTRLHWKELSPARDEGHDDKVLETVLELSGKRCLEEI